VPDSLTTTVTAARDALHERMSETCRKTSPVQIREHQSRIDQFLIASSRHTTAVADVLVAETSRHLEAGRARDLARACRLVQMQLFTTKSRLYGSSQTVRLPWRTVWGNVLRSFEALLVLEQSAADDLAGRLSTSEIDAIAHRLVTAETTAPTRPHPNIPQRGLRGRVARRTARAIDSFWDAVEGRTPPAFLVSALEGDLPDRVTR
jgi:DNA-binding GntR family transcriptional regulator